MHNTPAMMSTSRPSNTRKDNTNLSTPITNQAPAKRKDVSNAPAASKRSRRSTQSKGKSFCVSRFNLVVTMLLNFCMLCILRC